MRLLCITSQNNYLLKVLRKYLKGAEVLLRRTITKDALQRFFMSLAITVIGSAQLADVLYLIEFRINARLPRLLHAVALN